MPIYAKPNSPVTKEVNNVGVFIGVVLLGPVFFLCTGMVGHFIFSLILTLIIGIPLWAFGLGWLVWFFYAFWAISFVNQKWLDKGWIRVDH